MAVNPCIETLFNSYPELHKYLEGKAGVFDHSKNSNRDKWINAAKELQNETLNNLHNAYNKIGLKGYEKTKPEVITPSVREVVSDGGEKKDDTHLIISASVKTRLAAGVKKQIIEIENGQPIVKEIEFSKEDAELELDRLEALVEKGRLTPDEFQRSYFGQSAVTEVITDARELISKDPVKFIKDLRNTFEEKITTEQQTTPSVEGSGEQKKVENNLGKLISIKTGKETKSLDEVMDQLKKESDRRASLSPEQKRREVDVKDAAASVKELLTKKALLEVRKQFEGLDEATVNKYQDIYDNDINKIYDAFPELGEAPVGKKSVLSYIKPVSQPTDIKQTQGSGEKNHSENIKDKFREEFSAKGVSDEHITGALALMDARAKSWASEGKGRTPEQWYNKIADVKKGEFETSDVQFQGGKLKAAIVGAATMLHPAEVREGKIIEKNKAVIEDTGEHDPVSIKVKDDRKIDATSNKPVTDRNNLSEDSVDVPTLQEIVWYANKNGIDPYTALAIAYQETHLSSDFADNPMRIRFDQQEDTTKSPVQQGVEFLKEKFDLANRLGKKTEAEQIQAYNGYGKLAKQGEEDGKISAYYGVDVSKEPIDTRKNPVYGKRVIDIRDNILKKNPELVKLVEAEKKNIAYQEEGGIKHGALETLQDGRVVIHALDAPDVSTMVHEIFHVFEKDLTDTERKQVEDFGGSEAFARAGERYLRDGESPSKGLQPLFEKFKAWLTNIYQSLKGSAIAKKISPQIKQIFDRLLTENKPTDVVEENKVSVILPEENKEPNIIPLKKEGETTPTEPAQTDTEIQKEITGEKPKSEPPPPQQPTQGTGIFFERPTTELSFRGLQNVANEFGYEDVKSRDRVSDIKEQTNARETSEDWASKGTYKKNIDELLSKIEDRELVPTAKQRLVLQQYLANESAKLRSIKDKNSNEFDEQLNVVKRIKDIGQIARQESGAALRIPEGGGSISHPIEDYADAMIAKMDANGVTELTEKQKSDVEERIKKYEEATREAENKVAVMEAKLSEIEAKKELSKSAKKVKQPTTKKTHDEFVAERKGYIEELKAAKKEQEDWIKDQGIQKMGISGFTLTPKMVKIVGKMVGSHVEEIGGKLSDVTKRIYDEIKEVFDGITQKDVHDIIAGVYNPERKTLSQLQIDLRNVREEAKLINKYDSLLKGQPLTEVGKRKRNQELKDIREKISGFKKEELAANKFYKEEISSDAKKLIAIRRRNESQERKIRSDISSKNYSEKSKSSVIANKELKQQFPKLYNEMIDAIHNREEAKHEYDIDLFRDQLSKRSFGAKATDFLSKVSGTIKAIVTGIDDSAVAIQTFVSLLSRPVIGAKALKIHAEAAFSQKVFDRFLTELHNSPDWPLIKESGLNVTEPKSLKATEKEEIFDNRFSGSIKIKGKEYKLIDAPLKPFERAFTALGNAVRVLAFREKAQSYIRQGYSFENNPELFKSLATRLNTESGRGKENQYIQQASKVVTLGIWSPKLMASKFNLLGISDLASLVLSKAGTEGYYRKLHPKERIEAIKDVAKFVGGVMAMSYAVALAFGAEVDTDPLSSTFMNVKFKNGKSINFTGGFSSYIRQVAQFIKGGVTTSGKFKKVNRLDVATRFFRGKTPPMTSAGINSLVGKNFMGQPTTPLEEGKKLLMPISVQGISKEIKNDGAESLFTEGIPTFFGFNITDAKDFDKSKKR